MELRPSAWFLVLILLAAGYAWSGWLQNGLGERFAALEVGFQRHSGRLDSLADLPDKVAAVESALLGQRRVLDNALGQAVAVQMSGQWIARLETLEGQLSERASWPGNTGEAAEFVDGVSALVSELSPLAEATYVARLARLRWAAVAFDALQREPIPVDARYDLVDQLRAIADAKPAGVDAELEEELRRRADDLLTDAEESAFAAVVKRAERTLASAEADPGCLAQTAGEFQDAYDDLAFYLEDASRGAKSEVLRERLARCLAEHAARDQAAALREQWKHAKQLAGTHSDAYDAAARMLLGEVTGARAMAILSGVETSAYDDLIVKVQRAVNDLQDGYRRAYQEWALNQIFGFEDEHDRTWNAEQNRLDVEPGPVEDTRDGLFPELIKEVDRQVAKLFSDACADPPSCEALRNAMVVRLLPIDHLLLDLAVLKRYQRVYDAAWTALDEHPEQHCVAIAATFVPKRALRDVGAAPVGTDVALIEQLRTHQGCE